MISVVMITMNEEQAIRTVVGDIKKYAPGSEILIVDSSTDRTPEIAISLGVKVIRQYPPKGYGPAMDLALRSASGDAIVTMDCDNTYPADMIPVLAGYILDGGYDIADGSRLKSKPEAMPFANYIANAGFAFIASILFFRRITDLHSGMRAYRRSMLNSLKYNPEGAALPVELLLLSIMMGYKLKVVHIKYYDRMGQSTMMPLQSAWWTLKRILGVRFGSVKRR
jgi:glycosyltransferase involved in cell wall biosynthesis